MLRLSNDFLGIPRGCAFYRVVYQKTLKIRPIFKYIKQIKVSLYIIEASLSENKKKWGCLVIKGGVVRGFVRGALKKNKNSIFSINNQPDEKFFFF